MTVDFLNDLKIEKNRIIVLHVRLKGIAQNGSYSESTLQILEHLEREFSPKTILIPTFTYSFTKTGIFDTDHSPSEVGRFSEEARIMFGSQHRLINPVFSFIDTKNYFSETNYKFNTAFGDGSIFSYLSNEGFYVININLEKMVNSYFHYLEERFRVPYRKIHVFNGIIKDSENIQPVKFLYFARDLNANFKWNRTRLEDFLKKCGALDKMRKNNTIVSIVYSKDMDVYLGREIERDRNFLIR